MKGLNTSSQYALAVQILEDDYDIAPEGYTVNELKEIVGLLQTIIKTYKCASTI